MKRFLVGFIAGLAVWVAIAADAQIGAEEILGFLEENLAYVAAKGDDLDECLGLNTEWRRSSEYDFPASFLQDYHAYVDSFVRDAETAPADIPSSGEPELVLASINELSLEIAYRMGLAFGVCKGFNFTLYNLNRNGVTQ